MKLIAIGALRAPSISTVSHYQDAPCFSGHACSASAPYLHLSSPLFALVSVYLISYYYFELYSFSFRDLFFAPKCGWEQEFPDNTTAFVTYQNNYKHENSRYSVTSDQ